MDVSQNDAGGNSDEGKDSPVFIFQYGRAACFLKFRNGMCTLYIVLLILRSMYWPGDIGDTGTDTDTGDSTDTDDTGDFGDTEVNVLTRRSFKLGKDSQGFTWWEWES